jgi:hypothetical protein
MSEENKKTQEIIIIFKNLRSEKLDPLTILEILEVI